MGTSGSSSNDDRRSRRTRATPGRPLERGTPAPDARAIVLVGFMGAGKSTVGSCLARLLGWRFIDLDHEIERRAAASIPELFRAHGEAGFRTLERQATEALSPLRATVLAAGGGWFLDPEATTRLGAPVVTVWLRLGIDEALRRLADSAVERPLLAGTDARADAERLLRERERAYARADHVVDVEGMAAEEVATRVAQLIAGA